MSDQPLRIGFVGAGGINKNYRDSVKSLGHKIVAVLDVDPKSAADFCPADAPAVYTDHREMLDRAALDAVFIGIPPGAHTSQVADAAAANAAVFVAKPVDLNLDHARRTLDAIHKSGVVNQVGYMARYADITGKAKTLLEGRSPGMGIARFMCRMGPHPWWGKKSISGGQMLEQSTHVFDLLRYFLGEVTDVQAFGHKGNADGIADFEDSTVCNLHFAGGAIGNVASTCCTTVPEGYAMTELAGRDAYLKLIFDTRLTGRIDQTDIDFDGVETGYRRQVESFCAAVQKRDPAAVDCTFLEGVRTLAVTVAANRSLETGNIEKVAKI